MRARPHEAGPSEVTSDASPRGNPACASATAPLTSRALPAPARPCRALLADKLNANPTIYRSTVRRRDDAAADLDALDAPPDCIDELEVFEAIRHLNDPEHPLTLEQLNVTSIDGIVVDNERSTGAWLRAAGGAQQRKAANSESTRHCT